MERMLWVICRFKFDMLGGFINGEGSFYGEGEEFWMKFFVK